MMSIELDKQGRILELLVHVGTVYGGHCSCCDCFLCEECVLCGDCTCDGPGDVMVNEDECCAERHECTHDGCSSPSSTICGGKDHYTRFHGCGAPICADHAQGKLCEGCA